MDKKTAPINPVLLLIFFVLSVIAFPLWIDLKAQTLTETISMKPSIIEEVIDAGDVGTYTIEVINKSERTETFYPAVENMKGISDQGAPLFTVDESSFGLSDWISIHQESITIEPGESRELSFTVSVPEEAGPQGYYGAFFVTRQAPEQRRTGAAVDFKVGTILSFRIQGDAYEETAIREFTVGKNIYQNKEKAEFTIVVENLGNVLARPRGTISFINMFGDQVAQIPVNHPRPGGVFPGSSRTFKVEWEPESTYFGRIHAELDLTYGETGVRTISGVTSFWILPLIAMAVGGLGIIVFIGMIFALVRVYIRRQIKAATGGRRAPAYATVRAYSKPISKLTMMTMATVLFTVMFAGAVFFLFA